jgi:glyoxylase-like metal-dependent hydrolase (beta-lactamase superfamily II)
MSVQEIAPGIFEVCSELGSRTVRQWLCVGDRVAIVDTGIAGATVPDEILPALSVLEIGRDRVSDVLLTHADVDHYGGNAELMAALPAARFRAHRLDAPLISSFARIRDERYRWYRLHGLDYPADAWAFITAAAGADTPIEGSLGEHDVIDLGGLLLETLYLPGHSRGHVGFLVRDLRLAIVADAVQGRGFPSRDGRLVGPPAIGDVIGYRATTERLRELDLELLATAHFPLMERGEIAPFLAETLTLMDELEAEIDAALRDGPVTVAALLPRCDAALGPYEELTLELARPIGAALEEREARHEVIRVEAAVPTWSLP